MVFELVCSIVFWLYAKFRGLSKFMVFLGHLAYGRSRTSSLWPFWGVWLGYRHFVFCSKGTGFDITQHRPFPLTAARFERLLEKNLAHIGGEISFFGYCLIFIHF